MIHQVMSHLPLFSFGRYLKEVILWIRSSFYSRFNTSGNSLLTGQKEFLGRVEKVDALVLSGFGAGVVIVYLFINK